MTEAFTTEAFNRIAILRGVTPEHVIDVAETLVTHGFHTIEIPLNSPTPFQSIGKLAAHFGSDLNIGAGTVLETDQVKQVQDAGASFFLTPNTHRAVIEKSVELTLPCIAGFATPSEAVEAINAGAVGLKLFPADHFGVNYLKAIQAILPGSLPIYAVGGISAQNWQHWLQGGATGVGLGSSLYRAGMTIEQLAQSCQAFGQQQEVGHYA